MDEKDFKKHLKDLAEGHHHPEEHDWEGAAAVPAPARTTRKPVGAKNPVAAKKTASKKRKVG